MPIADPPETIRRGHLRLSSLRTESQIPCCRGGRLTLREDIACRQSLKIGRALSATKYVVPYKGNKKSAAPELPTLPSKHAASSTDPDGFSEKANAHQ